MKNDLPIKNGILIPENELEITTSRASGAGGQHVNKTNTRITVRWSPRNTNALSDEQKERVIERLQSQLTSDGELIVHNSESRSQQQNKKLALLQLAKLVSKALYIPKKRMATKTPKMVKEARLQTKKHRGRIKSMRSKKIKED